MQASVMWNDIDLYHDLRDFTSDPERFPPEEMAAFTQELAQNGQHCKRFLDCYRMLSYHRLTTY